ncbi:MAG: dihydroneopterin aldolase [Chloroflexi bacterium]|nr:dihydroneopterin aldolase [Chloroflexota bacterium]
MYKDKIMVNGMVFYGYHGVHPAEKELGQRFVIDLEMVADLSEAARTDDLSKTLNYSEAYRITKEVVEGPSRNLIEAVAEEIAAKVLAALPAAEVTVRVHKPQSPIKAAGAGTPSVEITRPRGGGYLKA